VERRHDSFQSGFSAGFEKGRKSSTQRRFFRSRPEPRRQPQPVSPMTTRASTTSDDSNGFNSSSPRSSNTMLHDILTTMRNNADETQSVRDRRTRDAPLAHSWTLGRRRSNVDSTSPLLSSDGTEEPRTMIRPALELLRQKRREQETQSD
jgi:hypothetical protein